MIYNEDTGKSCYESMSPTLVPLNRLLKQRDALAMLCGEMLATLKIPQNKEPLRGLGVDLVKDNWQQLLQKWDKTYDENSGDPNG